MSQWKPHPVQLIHANFKKEREETKTNKKQGKMWWYMPVILVT
jgi:hypothetical protein